MKTNTQLFHSTQILLYSYIRLLSKSQSHVGRGPEFHQSHSKYPLPRYWFFLISHLRRVCLLCFCGVYQVDGQINTIFCHRFLYIFIFCIFFFYIYENRASQKLAVSCVFGRLINKI